MQYKVIPYIFLEEAPTI